MGVSVSLLLGDGRALALEDRNTYTMSPVLEDDDLFDIYAREDWVDWEY